MSLPTPAGHWTNNGKRPAADFTVEAELLRRWKRIHREVQLALAIVLARDPAVRRLSAWPGEDPNELLIDPTLVFAAEGGIGIRVRHAIDCASAFGPHEIESRRSRTELRLGRDVVTSKDGDPYTWHAVAQRAAGLIEEFAYVFRAAPPGDDRAAVRSAAETLSGLRGDDYDAALSSLNDSYGNADNLVQMLGARLR